MINDHKQYSRTNVRGQTLSIEETGHPETGRLGVEDPLGELVVPLKQLGEPESDGR